MKLSLLDDGSLIDTRGVAVGHIVSIEVELFGSVTLPLTPAEVREMTECPVCGAPRREPCQKWGGGERKENHAVRVKIALALADELDRGDTVSERSERKGNSVVSKTENVEGTTRNLPSEVKERRPTAAQLERAAVERVWTYYLEVIPSRRQLDAKRARIIRSALTTIRRAYGCDLTEAEKIARSAVLGLSRSPHHNGANDQGKKYLEIRYALKGIGDESDDERIEKAVTWAALHAPNAPKADPEKISRWLDEVRYHLEKLATGSQGGAERAREAFSRLRAAGFKVERLQGPPWARVSR